MCAFPLLIIIKGTRRGRSITGMSVVRRGSSNQLGRVLLQEPGEFAKHIQQGRYGSRFTQSSSGIFFLSSFFPIRLPPHTHITHPSTLLKKKKKRMEEEEGRRSNYRIIPFHTQPSQSGPAHAMPCQGKLEWDKMSQRGVIVDSNKKSKSKSTAQAMLRHEKEKSPTAPAKESRAKKNRQISKQALADCAVISGIFFSFFLSSPPPSSVHFLIPSFLCGMYGSVDGHTAWTGNKTKSRPTGRMGSKSL